MPAIHLFAENPHRNPRHRADPAPLGCAERTRAVLNLLALGPRPRPGERAERQLHLPATMDLHQSDPRTIGPYGVSGRLGSGSQGVVYLAVAPSGDLVAIKRLHGPAQNEQTRRQFTTEVTATGRVAPFCTATLIEAYLEGPAPYLVSEYVRGPSLRQKITQDGPMTGAPLHRLAIGTATALAAIHQAGVVHRDVTPANVMLSPEGVRVIDFGIARNVWAEATSPADLIGTPDYLSPEQLRHQAAGPASDMFAWAGVIVYAATGRPPFQADHPMALAYRIAVGAPTLTGVPAALIPVLRRCLEKDPTRRPTASQALTTLLSRPELINVARFRSSAAIGDQVAPAPGRRSQGLMGARVALAS